MQWVFNGIRFYALQYSFIYSVSKYLLRIYYVQHTFQDVWVITINKILPITHGTWINHLGREDSFFFLIKLQFPVLLIVFCVYIHISIWNHFPLPEELSLIFHLFRSADNTFFSAFICLKFITFSLFLKDTCWVKNSEWTFFLQYFKYFSLF